MRKLVLVIGLCIGLSAAGNFLVNHNFEEALSVGWQSYLTSATYDSVMRGTGYEPDPDYEAYLTKSFGGYAKLWQAIDIMTVDSFSFSIKAKLPNLSFAFLFILKTNQ